MGRSRQNPWWHPVADDQGWDAPLPDVITLAPDYGAELPLWGGDPRRPVAVAPAGPAVGRDA